MGRSSSLTSWQGITQKYEVGTVSGAALDVTYEPYLVRSNNSFPLCGCLLARSAKILDTRPLFVADARPSLISPPIWLWLLA